MSAHIVTYSEKAFDMIIPNNQIWIKKLADSTVGLNTSYFEQQLINTTSNNDGWIIFEFNDDLTSIGNYAFNGCSGLTSVVIPDSVTTIGEAAFQNCSGLTSVEIGSGVTTIGEWAFNKCSGLESIVIPDSVTTIGEAAFFCCYNLTKVEIGAGVATIDYGAFFDCENLFEIVCHAVIAPNIKQLVRSVKQKGVLKVPSGSDYSTWMSTDSYYLGYYNWTVQYFNPILECTYNVTTTTSPTKLCYNTDSIEKITVDGTEINPITDYIFNTAGEHSVVFQLNTNVVADYLFSECYSLASIKIDTSIVEIGWSAFQSCTDLTTVEIGNGVATIDYGAFEFCYNLTSIVIPDSVTSIGENAFQHCRNLKSIVIPDSVTSIGSYAFSMCYKLSDITLSNSILTINERTFQSCTGLTSITIPESVTVIGDAAFFGCSKLNSITCNAVTAPIIQASTFRNVKREGLLYIPEDSDYSTWLDKNMYYLGYYGWVRYTDTDDNPPEITYNNINVFGFEGGTQTINVTYKNIINVYYPTSNVSWLTVTDSKLVDTTETSKTYAHTIQVSTNNSTEPRSANLIFSGDSLSTVYIVDQDACMLESSVRFSSESIRFDYLEEKQFFEVTYINIKEIEVPYSSANWLKIDKGAVTEDDNIVTASYSITVNKNETTDERASSITCKGIGLNGEEVYDVLMVYQNPIPSSTINVSPSAISFNADSTLPQTVDVTYKYFNVNNIKQPTITANWLKLSSRTVQSNENSNVVIRYSFTVVENTTSASRTTKVTFSGEGEDGFTRTTIVNVTQNPPKNYSNYIGYFKDIDGLNYTVKLISDSSDPDYREIYMAGESPFVVNFQTSDTLFDTVKQSTATITVVHNSYMENLLSPYAQGTKVEVKCENVIKWVGFLTPKIYNQDWVNEYETIELEASDCLASLQYFEYEAINNKGFVSFKQILDDVIARCGLINGYYWPQSKWFESTMIEPSNVGVYEKNFYSNDTDEPWMYQEVLEEFCKYFGVTCVQVQNDIYFLDYCDFMTQPSNDSLYNYFSKDGNKQSYFNMLSHELTSELFMANDGQISFEPIYNKVVVKDNMYNCEELFPNIFEDEYLTNRNGEYHYYQEVEPIEPYVAEYPYGSKNFKQKFVKENVDGEKLSDKDYKYFIRVYDNKYFETVYDGRTTMWGGDSIYLLRNVLQGSIVDFGYIDSTYEENDAGQTIIPNSFDYTRYICIPEKHTDEKQNTGKVVFRLKEGYKMPCMVSDDAYLVVNCSARFTRYNGRPYINPDWTDTESKLHLDNGSEAWDECPSPMFRLTIGDKAWSGFRKRWVELNDYYNYFETPLESPAQRKRKKGKLKQQYWNTDLGVLNQIGWEYHINESGYIIPLKGIDLTGDIRFEILCPAPSCYGRDKNYNWFMMKYNAYCWISDLSVKIVEKGQDIDRLDNDVVYENVIDENSVSSATEIEFKLTTYNEQTKPSFSNVIYIDVNGNKFLTNIQDRGLNMKTQRAEENCIERIVNQYSTSTKQLNVTLKNTYNKSPRYNSMLTPLVHENTTYIPVGTEIDYAAAKENITLIEIK